MRTETRRNDDGTIDEVLLYDDNNQCVFHMEQMSKKSWYFGLYPNGVEDIEQFYIHGKGKVWVRAGTDS